MISVCLATYNGEFFIAEQLKSILQQLPKSPFEAEIIIADDASNDNTLKIIKNIDDIRIRILKSDMHLGIIRNFERTLNVCSGDIIFLADQDDIWLPNKVQTVIKYLKNFDLAMHDAFLYVNENSNWICNKKLSDIRKFRKGIFCNWLKNNYTGCCMAFKRNVLKYALPFPKNIPMHDQWIGFVATRFFKVAYIKTPLIKFRRHNANATNIVKSHATFLQQIKWRINLAVYIIASYFKFKK